MRLKRALAALLCAALPVACVLPASAAGTAPTGFAVASDLHYNLPEAALSGEIDDPLYFYANRRLAMENESGFLIDAFLAQCAADDTVQYVLISGDLADNGRRAPAEHAAVAEKLRAFEERSGKQVFVINGNHDASLNGGDFNFDDFKRVYADFGYDLALETRADDCSYTADLGDEYRLIALDSCSPDKSTEDGMTAAKVRWVLAQAGLARRAGRYPILMLHHNLLEHLPAQRIISHDFIVRFHNSTAALFADAGVRLVLSGHEHCSDAAGFTSPAGNRIYDFATTSLTMYPLAYRVFSLTPEKIGYRSVKLGALDTAALSDAVDGYTPAQLAAMRTDLNAYAKGFFRAGLRYRLTLSLSDEKLGIKASDPAYPVVHTAVSALLALLDTPYGELRETAAAYGIDLPDCGYEKPWDLACDLAAAHYEGEENYLPTSNEVRLLLRTAALILKTALAETADETLLRAANRIFAADGTPGLAQRAAQLSASAFGGITPAGTFTAALLSPLLCGFAYDGDGVPDNDGGVPGYGENAPARNLLRAFTHMMETLRLYLRLFTQILCGR